VIVTLSLSKGARRKPNNRSHKKMTINKTIQFLFLLLATLTARPQSPRTDISLNTHWRTIATDSTLTLPSSAWNQPANGQRSTANDFIAWKPVNIPHNWDDYDGYRRQRHGNRHGTAWYRKSFIVKEHSIDRRFFLFFEGVGSYATIWLNGHKAGYHAGGRNYVYIGHNRSYLHQWPSKPACRTGRSPRQYKRPSLGMRWLLRRTRLLRRLPAHGHLSARTPYQHRPIAHRTLWCAHMERYHRVTAIGTGID